MTQKRWHPHGSAQHQSLEAGLCRRPANNCAARRRATAAAVTVWNRGCRWPGLSRLPGPCCTVCATAEKSLQAWRVPGQLRLLHGLAQLLPPRPGDITLRAAPQRVSAAFRSIQCSQVSHPVWTALLGTHQLVLRAHSSTSAGSAALRCRRRSSCELRTPCAAAAAAAAT